MPTACKTGLYFQICTWLHADTTVTLNTALPAQGLRPFSAPSFWHLTWLSSMFTEQTQQKSSQLFGSEKTTEMKSLTTIKVCFRCWGQAKVIFIIATHSKQRNSHVWHWDKTSDLLYMISYNADFIQGSSALCRGRQLLQWWHPCVTQIFKSASHNQ